MIRAIGFLAFLLTTWLHAADPYLVRDLDTRRSPSGSFTSSSWLWPSSGPVVYFVADDGTGANLWSTDGTTTRRITSDGTLSRADFIGQLGRTVIYSARDKVWASDGGAPVELMTIGTNGDAFPRATFRNELYFQAYTAGAGEEIWKTDGTPGGTKLLDLLPGPSSSDAHSFIVVGDAMYFFGRTVAGQGLHRTDGTVSGTTMVHTVDSWDPGMVSLGNGKFVFFVPDEPSETSSLWVSDGTAAGTTMLRNGFTESIESYAQPMALLGNRMIFTADEPAFGEEMWVTDGTTAGTRLLHDLAPGPEWSSIKRGARVGDRYFFAADVDDDVSLYTTDGTSAGLQKVTSLQNTPSFSAPASINGRFLFVRRHDDYGTEWWTSDGTAAGTQLLIDVAAGRDSGYAGTTYARLPNALIFRANDDEHGMEPFITDGTPSGTRLLVDIHPDFQYGFSPEQLQWSGSRLFFASAQTDAIAVSDGTESGTSIIGTSNGRVVDSAIVNGLYFYVTRSEVSGSVRYTVWRTDGTSAGTIQLHQQTSGEYDLDLVPFRNGVLFAGYDGSLDLAPWFSDGTVAGTKRVRDLDPNGAARNLPVFHVSGNSAWIGFGNTVWTTDGTEAGTVQIASLNEPAAVIQHLTNIGAEVLFTSVSPSALWRGSERIATLPGAASNLFVNGNLLYLTSGAKMWRSDGTAAGTFALDETDAMQCNATALASIGNVTYWLTGKSLWRTDGTTGGTTRVATFSRSGCELIAHDRRLLFSAETTGEGEELWSSDGTSANTRLLADLEPGPVSSIPRSLTLAGNRLFFAATSREFGRELFAYDMAKSGKSRAVRH